MTKHRCLVPCEMPRGVYNSLAGLQDIGSIFKNDFCALKCSLSLPLCQIHLWCVLSLLNHSYLWNQPALHTVTPLISPVNDANHCSHHAGSSCMTEGKWIFFFFCLVRPLLWLCTVTLYIHFVLSWHSWRCPLFRVQTERYQSHLF